MMFGLTQCGVDAEEGGLRGFPTLHRAVFFVVAKICLLLTGVYSSAIMQCERSVFYKCLQGYFISGKGV